jgi:hypothetical protein
MIEAGLPITDLTQTFIMSGIGNGKWTLDFGLLLAGPVAHIMQIMAKSYGLKYDLGLDDKVKPNSSAFFKVVSEINRAKAAAAGRATSDQIDDIQEDTTKILKNGAIQRSVPLPKFKSFGSIPNPQETTQEQMLGQEQAPQPEGV